MRHSARQNSVPGMTKVRSAPAEAWHKADAISVSAYRAALSIIALVAGFVAIRWALKVVSYEPTGTDDSRVLVYTGEILRNPGSWIFNSELPLLQYFTYASLINVFGWGMPVVLVPLLSSAALAVLVGYIAYQFERQPWAFLAAALAMASLPVFLVRARSLPFYPPMLLFGYGGVFAAIAYLRGGGRLAFVLGVLGLVAALYSFAMGILFLPVPLIYLLVDRGRPVVLRLGRLYAVVAGLVLPWFVWHLAVGGLDGLRQQQMNWQIERGYQTIRNLEFFGAQTESRTVFVENLPRMLEDATGPLMFVLGALSIVGLARLPTWSWRAAVLITLAIPIGTLIYATPAIYARYTYTLIPALVLLSVYGFHGVVRWLSSSRLTAHLARVVAAAAVALLGVVFVQNALDEMNTVDRIEAGSTTGDLPQVASLISDDKAILGSRVLPLTRYKPENALLGMSLITEEDAVTYLLWPSDEAVAGVFRRNNVGWVIIRHPAETWEMNYHIWMRKAAGQLPRHHLVIQDSSLIEQVFEGSIYSLYRVVGSSDSAAESMPLGQ